jgi:hypothetical protein
LDARVLPQRIFFESPIFPLVISNRVFWTRTPLFRT